MANTNALKRKIEPELSDKFIKKYHCKKLEFQNKRLHEIFMGMEPDVVGYNQKEKKLYIGEITASGFYGGKRSDFHIGGAKKLTESFVKLYLCSIPRNLAKIKKQLQNKEYNLVIKSLSCHFIVPKDSRFIKALGYRDQLFERGKLKLEEFELSAESRRLMDEVYNNAKAESSK